MEDANNISAQEEDDLCIFTEESVNLSNHIKYLDDDLFQKEKASDNLVDVYNWFMPNKGRKNSTINKNNESKFDYFKLEEELLNFRHYEIEKEQLEENEFPYSEDNHNLIKAKDNIDKSSYKIEGDSFKRMNKFRLEVENDPIENTQAENQDNTNYFLDQPVNNVVVNPAEAKINIFSFAHLLKPEEYFPFITVGLIIKHLNADSKYESIVSLKSLASTDKYKRSIKDFYLNYMNEDIHSSQIANLIKSSIVTDAQEFINLIVKEKSIKEYNFDNSFLIHFVKFLSNNSINSNDRIYLNWKIYLGRLVTVWDFKRASGLNSKLGIKYLKLKFLLVKLFKRKEKANIFYFKTNNTNSTTDAENELVNHKFSRFTLYQDGFLNIIYDFVIDLSLIYFLIILPMIVVIHLSSPILNFVDQVFHAFYFFNMLRRFRTLIVGEKNEIMMNLIKPFKKSITDIFFYIDIVSLIPFDILVISGNPDSLPTTYSLCRFLVLLRIFRFGKSFKFLESTKYAAVFRLMKLMGQFILLIHWCGLFLLLVFHTEIFTNPNWWDNTCETYDAMNPYSFNCEFVSAIYSGGFLGIGKSLASLSFLESFRTNLQYFYLFGVSFIGQIITAYVFSSVSDVIQNMNQAENAFQEIKDNHQITAFFYQFDDEVANDINLYYNYTWLKHREKIYGMKIFDDLSNELRTSLTKAMIPPYKYILKDFLSANNSTFTSFIFNHLTKYIAYPYERLISQGHPIKGLFILANGSVLYEDEPRLNQYKKNVTIDFHNNKVNVTNNQHRKMYTRKDLTGEINLNKNIINEKLDYIETNQSHKYINDKVIFPLDSLFIKTGRAIQTYYVRNFTDLFLIETEMFDDVILPNYPYEMFHLSKKGKQEGLVKLGNDYDLLSIVRQHSSRSTGKYYEDHFTIDNMWIEIKSPLPKFKLKTMTLVNKLDIISNLGDCLGIFENADLVSKVIPSRLYKSEKSALIANHVVTNLFN